ncbi:glycoside hydrolase family 172 protein [Pleomorphomonas koreensis]|uniref:glycoside hydrolase family 172 protein n=1 Tax=Pleomorphomonas koreensis TaxID=257440 RepID=UPI000420FA53|nr:glycoside hydrolase family 172 protein [Pleomorphomonas koreensis]
MSNLGLSPLRGLAKLRKAKTRRFSSYDRTGGNDDRLHIATGETVTIAEAAGAGIVTHIWVTIACDSPHYLRKIILRAYWDGESEPSIEAPIGDFFGMGHAKAQNFWSLPLQMSPQDGKGFNCYFPMPFGSHMKFTVTSEAEDVVQFYYYVDLELHDRLEDDMGRFHAQFRLMRPEAADETGMSNEEYLFGGVNTAPRDNYLILDAVGHGHYVGCTYSVYSLRRHAGWDWYGEGDDMIFVDGEPGLAVPDAGRQPQIAHEERHPELPAHPETSPGANDAWPPTLHGTGTEDYFNTSWCPNQDYSAPYHGIIAGGGPNWTDPVSVYRFHIEDPVVFQQRIRVTIEHGHANRRGDSISSVAYWYQTEPHKPFGAFPACHDRLPDFRAPFEARGPKA